MDEIVVNQIKYISSKRAAKLTGYAKDYVGQLVRMGKLDAQRVGRAWYVSEEGIMLHAGLVSNIGSSQIDDSSSAAALSVQTKQSYPVVGSLSPETTVGAALYPIGLTPATALPKTWSKVTYSEDNSDLYPVPRNIPDTTNSKKVSILVSDSRDYSLISLRNEDSRKNAAPVNIANSALNPRFNGPTDRISSPTTDGIRFEAKKLPPGAEFGASERFVRNEGRSSWSRLAHLTEPGSLVVVFVLIVLFWLVPFFA